MKRNFKYSLYNKMSDCTSPYAETLDAKLSHMLLSRIEVFLFTS